MKKLFNWLLGFFRKEKLYRYKIVKDMPDRPEKNMIYIFDHLGYHWQLVMICPCGCNTLLHLNLNEDDKPYWRYSLNNKKRISITPSLHRKTDCKSHFFVRLGKIDWC